MMAQYDYLDRAGIDNLVQAIYKQAVMDYIAALIAREYFLTRDCERFFNEGHYLADKKQGAYISAKCREWVEAARVSIEAVLDGGENKVRIDKGSIDWLIYKLMISADYSGKMKWKTEKGIGRIVMKRRNADGSWS